MKKTVIFSTLFILISHFIYGQTRMNRISEGSKYEGLWNYAFRNPDEWEKNKNNYYWDSEYLTYSYDYSKIDTIYFATRKMRGKEKKIKAEISFLNDKPDYLFGTTDKMLKPVLEPDYSSILVISSKSFFGYLLQKGVYLIDLEKNITKKSPYYNVFQRGYPSVTFGTKSRRDYYGNSDLVVVRPDLSESEVIENFSEKKNSIFFMDNNLMVVPIRDVANDKYYSLLCNIKGEKIAKKNEINAFVAGSKQTTRIGKEEEKWEKLYKNGANRVFVEQIGTAKINISNSNILYHPLEFNGTPMELPYDVIGVMPIIANDKRSWEHRGNAYVNGWVLVSKNGDKYSYRIGEGRPEDVLAQYNNLEVLEYVNQLRMDYDYSQLKSANLRFANYSYMVMDVIIGKVLNRNEYKIADVLYYPKILKGAKNYGNSMIKAKNNLELERIDFIEKIEKNQAIAFNKKKELDAKQQQYFLESFNKNFGSSNQNTIRDLHNWSLSLGDDYFRKYIMRYYPFNNSDVQYACSLDASACQKAQSDWNRMQYENTNSQSGYNNSNNNSDEVRVLIYDNGVMRQEVYTKSHYNKYYKNN